MICERLVGSEAMVNGLWGKWVVRKTRVVRKWCGKHVRIILTVKYLNNGEQQFMEQRKVDIRDNKEHVENPRQRVHQTLASKPNDITSSRKISHTKLPSLLLYYFPYQPVLILHFHMPFIFLFHLHHLLD